ncbi:hypothetical protein F6V30_07850 [Oryzomonas sagensis]|uniref:Uncharacterized protein n=1 Tax=Oryzomonas sagensis TaxID=2603857 RepID=A0ABQ6TUQ2_9BACT|nr:hypothetical protein [Oryzomonas sagensis]KAB0672464.1 hypothetical protein F6V30_07850 [Oryzomonas sagensis]
MKLKKTVIPAILSGRSGLPSDPIIRLFPAIGSGDFSQRRTTIGNGVEAECCDRVIDIEDKGGIFYP